jgi:hypothetical protein
MHAKMSPNDTDHRSDSPQLQNSLEVEVDGRVSGGDEPQAEHLALLAPNPEQPFPTGSRSRTLHRGKKYLKPRTMCIMLN